MVTATASCENDRLDFDRLNQFIEEGRLLRGKWKGTDAQGRETACAIVALYPPCGDAESTSACPASLMDPWLAELVTWIDDSGSDDKWPANIRRLAAVLPKVVALPVERRDVLANRIGALIVREAMSHITRDEWGCKAACEQTIAALESGDRDKISAAESAARSAAWSAAESAATSAAWSAAGSAAWSAATSAAWSAAWSAARSAAWSAARSAAESAARSAAEDRLIDGMLTAMEQAVAS